MSEKYEKAEFVNSMLETFDRELEVYSRCEKTKSLKFEVNVYYKAFVNVFCSFKDNGILESDELKQLLTDLKALKKKHGF